jgi:hypothetical protein
MTTIIHASRRSFVLSGSFISEFRIISLIMFFKVSIQEASVGTQVLPVTDLVTQEQGLLGQPGVVTCLLAEWAQPGVVIQS